MDDFFDDFDGDNDEGFDHDDDDADFGETPGEFESEAGPAIDEDVSLEAENDHCRGIQWQDWMLLGPISEEIAREKAEEERLIRENDKGED
ncbi:MAG: hypothetical protein RBT11_08790 [Desulfobacterales bacterium]|jgi:hypothetical protein|nr:hypothetical protein [Desulfobacterales bacterium]